MELTQRENIIEWCEKKDITIRVFGLRKVITF